MKNNPHYKLYEVRIICIFFMSIMENLVKKILSKLVWVLKNSTKTLMELPYFHYRKLWKISLKHVENKDKIMEKQYYFLISKVYFHYKLAKHHGKLDKMAIKIHFSATSNIFCTQEKTLYLGLIWANTIFLSILTIKLCQKISILKFGVPSNIYRFSNIYPNYVIMYTEKIIGFKRHF